MDNLEFTHRVYHPVSAFYVYFAESFGGSGSLYCPPQLTGLNPALRPIIRGRATCIVCGVRLTPGLHTVQILRRRMRRPDSHAQGHVFLSSSSTAGAGIERRVTRVPRGALQRPCRRRNGEYAVGCLPAPRNGDSDPRKPRSTTTPPARTRTRACGMRKVPFRGSRATGVRSFRIPRSSRFFPSPSLRTRRSMATTQGPRAPHRRKAGSVHSSRFLPVARRQKY